MVLEGFMKIVEPLYADCLIKKSQVNGLTSVSNYFEEIILFFTIRSHLVNGRQWNDHAGLIFFRRVAKLQILKVQKHKLLRRKATENLITFSNFPDNFGWYLWLLINKLHVINILLHEISFFR